MYRDLLSIEKYSTHIHTTETCSSREKVVRVVGRAVAAGVEQVGYFVPVSLQYAVLGPACSMGTKHM